MMSIHARRELSASIAARYQKVNKKDKARILDEFVTATGYSRKHAISVLGHPPASAKSARAKRSRKRRYGTDVEHALIQIWKAGDGLCSKRLVPFLPELITALERHNEIEIASTTRQKLLTLSPATCDRLLARQRGELPRRGLSTTKPGTLLKTQIPIRTYADWNEKQPGSVEVDLVAHCGDSTAGEFLYSLTLTDVYSGWTECVALPNRGQVGVCAAIETVRARLPFTLLGLDCDNGSEFLDAHLLRYCTKHQITFTRCRPYQKNDQCFVEHKNGALVRRWTGYSRFEGEEAAKAMQALYRGVRSYVNCFQPSVKLVSKERVGAKIRKEYDTAKTPHQRLQECTQIADALKKRLKAEQEALNPADLLRRMQVARQRLQSYGRSSGIK